MLTAVSGLAASNAGTSCSSNNCRVLCSQSVSQTSRVIGRPVAFECATMGAAGTFPAVVAVSPPAWDERCSDCPLLVAAAGWAARAGVPVGCSTVAGAPAPLEHALTISPSNSARFRNAERRANDRGNGGPPGSVAVQRACHANREIAAYV